MTEKKEAENGEQKAESKDRKKRKHGLLDELLDKDRLPIIGKALDLIYPTILVFTIAFLLAFYKLMNPQSDVLNYIMALMGAGFILLIYDYLR